VTSNDETDAPEEVDMRAATRAFQRARSSGTDAKSARGRDSSKAGKRSRKKTGSTGSDPTLVGAALADLIAEQGWEENTSMAGLSERWPDIVGPEVAEHVQIESWSDGELVLRADSTAWATQVRLLTGTLLEQVRAAVGPGVVDKVQVNGPTAPSWKAGPRVVKGRGPRDTYG